MEKDGTRKTEHPPGHGDAPQQGLGRDGLAPGAPFIQASRHRRLANRFSKQKQLTRGKRGGVSSVRHGNDRFAENYSHPQAPKGDLIKE